jgi:hypothetical protein
MSLTRFPYRLAISALAGLAMLSGEALAVPLPPLETASPVVLAQGDCYAIGEQIAAQNGGTLAKASPSTQGGQSVCVVVILVPGKDGQRPRRVQMVVPQN